MRFVTAPDPMEYVQDKGFRERLGAVTNRTYRVGAKRFQTAPVVRATGYRTPISQVLVRLQTAPTGLELSGSKPHLPGWS